MTDEFILGGFKSPVTVELHKKITQAKLLSYKAFSDWQNTLKTNLELQYTDTKHAFHEDPYVLYNIEIQSVDFFTDTIIGFVKLKAELRNSKNGTLPGIAFLRGGSVAMLMILRPEDSRDERWVVMTEQPRVPAGSLSFIEIPAGMLDNAGNFAGKAAAEIKEETGFKLPESELIDLTALALKESKSEGETLQNAMYPSPGGCDEYIPIFLWEKELNRQEIMDLTGKLSGKRSQGEMITLRVVDYEQLWKICPRDAKTLAAWALYEGLSREGVIQEELRKRKKGSRSSIDAGGHLKRKATTSNT